MNTFKFFIIVTALASCASACALNVSFFARSWRNVAPKAQIFLPALRISPFYASLHKRLFRTNSHQDAQNFVEKQLRHAIACKYGGNCQMFLGAQLPPQKMSHENGMIMKCLLGCKFVASDHGIIFAKPKTIKTR